MTWNLPIYEEKFRGWIADFKELHPDFEVEWLDKKGTEWATFYQTQLIAGTAPDIIDVQGMLWAEYAAADGLVDLTPYLDKEPEVSDRFNQEGMTLWQYDGKQYMLPYYFSKSLMIYNKDLFEAAGLDGPPDSFDAILEDAQADGGDGRGPLRLHHAELRLAVLAAVRDERRRAPERGHDRGGVQHARDAGRADQARRGDHLGRDQQHRWTGRWVEPNNAFATGDIGMYQAHGAALFWIAGNAEWVNADTLGVVEWPGGWGVPNAHGFGISQLDRSIPTRRSTSSRSPPATSGRR